MLESPVMVHFKGTADMTHFDHAGTQSTTEFYLPYESCSGFILPHGQRQSKEEVERH